MHYTKNEFGKSLTVGALTIIFTDVHYDIADEVLDFMNHRGDIVATMVGQDATDAYKTIVAEDWE